MQQTTQMAILIVVFMVMVTSYKAQAAGIQSEGGKSWLHHLLNKRQAACSACAGRCDSCCGHAPVTVGSIGGSGGSCGTCHGLLCTTCCIMNLDTTTPYYDTTTPYDDSTTTPYYDTTTPYNDTTTT
ncbi:unnamed protein product [Adineta steineri]|uniref:Uncharacterized protein n=1 Tax=Adineta steineri TaxID=433720 RepID=A0A814VN09_9BILA|nr:unnamed protein product [Adineta steineri]CAF3712638.1 unnamed protein product [Adineta steineri]